MTKTIASLVDQLELDVWSENSYETDIRVSPEELTLLTKLGLDYQVLIPNVQALIDEEERSLAQPAASFFDTYQRYSVIVSYLQSLVDANKNFTSYVASIGQSVEKRNIPAVRINVGNTVKPIIFISGGQHAREWVGPSTVIYILKQLLDNAGTTRVATILRSFNFVFIPLMNPDGYEYAHTNTRLWRKNRKANSGGTYGVDLNRNWGYKWGGAGSSNTPSSDTYRGTAAFSEPESNSVSTYFKSVGTVAGAIDYHSYSQLILRPWGDTRNNAPNEVKLTQLGAGIKQAIQQVGVAYTSQKSIDLYATTGTASDWYYANGATYSYTIELRDTGTYGFTLPVSQIIPTGQENYAGFLYFVEYIKSN